MIWQAIWGLAGAAASLTLAPAADGPIHVATSAQALSATVSGTSLASAADPLTTLAWRSGEVSLGPGSVAGFGLQSIASNTGYGSVAQSAVAVTANLILTTSVAGGPR